MSIGPPVTDPSGYTWPTIAWKDSSMSNGSDYFSGGGDASMFGDALGTPADWGSSGSGVTDTSITPYAYGGSGSDGGASAANYGSLLGGLGPSVLGNTGAGSLVGTTSGGGRKRVNASGSITYLGGGHARMNPLNPRALRRAISRVYRFETFAKRVLKITSPHHHVAGIKRRRRRRRSW